MEFEEIICPNCGSTLSTEDLKKILRCSICKVNFHNQKYVGFLEYLMMNGYIQELDFFDKTVYGDEINHTSETEEELRDETNPNEYEENRNKIKYSNNKCFDSMLYWSGIAFYELGKYKNSALNFSKPPFF